MTDSKQCTICRKQKLFNEFGIMRGGQYGVNSKCKSCCREWARLYRATNPERVRESIRIWQQANPEKKRECERIWKKTHREKVRSWARKWRANNLGKCHEYGRRWAKKNRQKVNAAGRIKAMRRKARKCSAAGANYTTAEHIRLRWEMFGGRCWICGRSATATDHVKPLAAGGAHFPCNLRPICAKCNSRKQAKWPLKKLAI